MTVVVASGQAEKYVVWLDGVRQEGVMAADDVAGTVTVLSKDLLGKYIWNGNGFQTEVRRGEVRIVRLHGRWDAGFRP